VQADGACTISAGPGFSAIVTRSGELFVFGSNTGGRLGISETEFDAPVLQVMPWPFCRPYSTKIRILICRVRTKQAEKDS